MLQILCDQCKRPDLTGGGLVRSHGGWKIVKGLRTAGIRIKGDERILGDSDFVIDLLKARALLCFWAYRQLGMTTVTIADKLNLCQSAVSRLSKRGEHIASELKIELLEGKA